MPILKIYLTMILNTMRMVQRLSMGKLDIFTFFKERMPVCQAQGYPVIISVYFCIVLIQTLELLSASLHYWTLVAENGLALNDIYTIRCTSTCVRWYIFWEYICVNMSHRYESAFDDPTSIVSFLKQHILYVDYRMTD